MLLPGVGQRQGQRRGVALGHRHGVPGPVVVRGPPLPLRYCVPEWQPYDGEGTTRTKYWPEVSPPMSNAPFADARLRAERVTREPSVVKAWT